MQGYEDPLQIDSENVVQSTVLESQNPLPISRFGNQYEIQDNFDSMTLLDITSTTVTPTSLNDNQNLVESEYGCVVQAPNEEVGIQNLVVPNKEKVVSENSFLLSASQTEIQTTNPQVILRSNLDLSGVEQLGTKPRIERFHQYLAFKVKEVRILPVFELENNGSKSNPRLIILEVMKHISKWLDQVEEMNKYFNERMKDLVEILCCYKRLKEMVDEKLSNFFSSEVQHMQSEYVRETLYKRGINLFWFLESYKNHLDEKYKKFGRYREHYLSSSFEATNYKFEEKLLDKGEHLLCLINKFNTVLNEVSVKSVKASAYVEFLYLECENMVTKYFNDIAVAFPE